MDRQVATQVVQKSAQTEAARAVPQQVASAPQPLHSLHQIAGNRAVGRFIQSKLTVSEPGDAYEQEADEVADRVMRMADPVSASPSNPDETVQRKCTECGSSAELCPSCAREKDTLQLKPALSAASLIQRQSAEEEENSRVPPENKIDEEPVQAKREPGKASEDSGAAEFSVTHLSGGQSLTSATRAFFEPRFAQDFADVRVHSGAEAAASARAVSALAYTAGADLVFNSGQYAPETDSGKRLLAHELAHVVQQRQGQNRQIMRVPDESGIKDTPPHYSYSTNCAWIDWSHASPGVTRPLIQAVQDASDRMTASGSTTPELVNAPAMESRAPLVGTLVSGVTPVVHIKRPLTQDEVLSVALRIYMSQSFGFEALQNWTDSLKSSSFSEEDLPSNLIAFYMAARSFGRTDIETFCDIWDSARSLTKFQGYTFRKSISFRPARLPSGGAWPSQLSTITPAVSGGDLMDLPEARFETTFSSFNRGLLGYEILAEGHLGIESLAGGTTIDISDTTPGQGPHFEVRPLPSGHGLQFRWIVVGPSDERFLMLGDDGSHVKQFGTQFNAFINAPSRQALRDRGITAATIRCRVLLGREGEGANLQQVLELPVTFTW